MKKTLTIVEAREMFGEACYETETGFLVNVFGKYCPNVTFVVGKEVELDANGKHINPLTYVSDREVTDSMNMDFDGDAKFMFGDFWRSKKGGACFRPKSPKTAKDLLIRVDWGGCFNNHRGTYSDEANAIEGVKYFRRASSNGGGAGCDFWVVPVGFYRALHIEEVDGNAKSAGTTSFETRAKAYREKHARLQREASEANDKAYKAKLAAEKESRANREKYLPRLTEIQAELAELHQPQKSGITYSVDEIVVGDTHFKMGHLYLYSEENLAKAEEYLTHVRGWIMGEEAKLQAKADARATFEPKFEELRHQIERVGWGLSFGEENAQVNCHRRTWAYAFSSDGVERLRRDIADEADRLAMEEVRAQNAARIRRLLSGTELPEVLWFLFEGSEDPDSLIMREVEAILAAPRAEKDGITLHELRNCGWDRRTAAIRRVLRQVGGDVADINIGSQAGSQELAYFILGLGL